MQTFSSVPGSPFHNTLKVRTDWGGWLFPRPDFGAANAWMRQDKANRMVELNQQWPYGLNQVWWQRTDENHPIGFTQADGQRWLYYYPEAMAGLSTPGDCLHNATYSGPVLFPEGLSKQNYTVPLKIPEVVNAGE